MSSQFIEHPPEGEGDQSLIFIMDQDGNMTTDPNDFERLMNTREVPDSGIKIVRLDPNTEDETSATQENDNQPQLKLTIEEIYPNSMSMVVADPTSSLLSSSLDILPSTSGESNSQDMVDPFSEMDPEQLQRLEHALASEQAKQILGENAAVMLDMLSVDEPSSTFLQDSIKNDHCYTNLLPSSDPNGPSFFVGDVRSNTAETPKAKGKKKVGNTAKGRKVSQGMSSSGSPPKRQVKEPQQPSKVDVKPSFLEFGKPRGKPMPELKEPSYEDLIEIEEMESDISEEDEDDNPSDEDYTDRAGRKKKKKPKRGKKGMAKRQPWSRHSRSTPKHGVRTSSRTRSCQELQRRTEKLVDEFSQPIPSTSYASRSEEDKPPEPTKEKPKDKGKDTKKVQKKRKSKEETAAEGPRVVESQVSPGETASAVKSQPAKQPKKEKSKATAHFAEALGPALFSAPDIIRRVSTGEEVPQTPPEKKNFTVGLQKSTLPVEGRGTPKSAESKKPLTLTIKKGESILKESVKSSKSASGEFSKQESLLKQAKPEPVPQPTVEPLPSPQVETAPPPTVETLPPPKVETASQPKAESSPQPKPESSTQPRPEYSPQPSVSAEPVPDQPIVQPSVSAERAPVIPRTNPEIQKLFEQHRNIPIRPSYGDDDDSSNDNGDENYCLDPTQMDQSLLETFTQHSYKSEDQVLQEALLLQEQLIGPSKSSDSEDKPKSDINFDDTLKDVVGDIPDEFVPESGDKTGSEEKSSDLLESETNMKAFGKSKDDGSHKASEGKTSKPDVTPMEIDDLARPSTSAGVYFQADPGISESIRRGVKRPAEDVSDLDSDLDDALSEASWNSEDDPDRLWCICRKPHNNRFMICCDVCEEWFHGKCVGITKTIGKQMEQDGLEWSCPNCAKKKKAEENVKEAEKMKLLKEKMAQSIKEQQQKIKETQKMKTTQVFLGKEKMTKPGKEQVELKDVQSPECSEARSSDEEFCGRQCIMCRGWVRDNSIYCGDDCIRKHSHQAISQLVTESSKKPNSESPGPSSQSDDQKLLQEFQKENSRIIVMDANTKKVLVGQQAPTAANLTNWLKENPSYQVVYKKSEKTGKYIVSTPKVVKFQTKSQAAETPQKIIQLPSGQKVSVQQPETVKSTQLKLAVSPTSKQVKILPAPVNPGKKQVYQIISSNSGGPSLKPATIIVRQKPGEGTESLPVVVKSPLPKPATKVTSLKAPAPAKETGPQKSDKMPRKKKEKGVKAPVATITTKDLRLSLQKLEEGKEKEKRDCDQQIRDSVKKALGDALKARAQDCEDLEFTEEYIDTLAVEIEDKLFKHFENKTDTKYKSKYRSLVFNIRDSKNETLFRKILDNSITPKDLVKLSPEELASQELARWREKENQHQLEMIKKSELELMTIGNTYIMKSHKGEQVIETAQSERVAAVAAEIDPNTSAQDLISALNSVASGSAKAAQEEDDEEEEEEEEEEEPALMRISKESRHRSSKDKDRKRSKKERERRRGRSRSRSRSRRHRSKEKKTSRDRRRHRNKKSYKKGKRESSESSDSRDSRRSRKSRDTRGSSESRDSTDSKDSSDSRSSRGRSRDSEDSRSGSGSPEDRGEPRNDRRDRNDRSDRSDRNERTERSGRNERTERSDRNERTDRNERNERTDRNERTERSERTERTERSDRNERTERSERTERTERSERTERTERSETARDAERVHRRAADEDADHEPSSTVTIKTPDINIDEPEPSYLWKGVIAMADVAKFWGIAREVSGNCTRLSGDVGDRVDIVGRIPYDTVWDYIARMKKMATKDIIVIKILPSNENERSSYSTLYSYLSKRSRIGVIGKTSEAVKDFYLYPLASHSSIPQVLLPLHGGGLEDERGNIILGIIVRSKRKIIQQRSLSIEMPVLSSKPVLKPPSLIEAEPEKVPDRSYTPPLPDDDKINKKDPRLKRKVRVQVDFNKPPVRPDDGDSPYSPGDSDDDLLPLPKIPKPTTPGISSHVKKFLPTATVTQETFQDPIEIQKKIEEMNRAIEEQTQQIQCLTSNVPKLKTGVPLPNIPLLSTSLLSSTSAGVSTIPHPKPSTSASISASKPTPEIVELPLISTDLEERARTPPRSFTPPIKIEETIPFLQEVKTKVSLPSNLQEMLNSINKKSTTESSEVKILPDPAKAVEDIVKSNTPDINMALNVLTQTKSLLNSLSSMSSAKETTEKLDESTPILSRLSDEDIIRKAKEMEELAHREKDIFLPPSVACPPRPLLPVVQDIPLISSGDSFGFSLPPSMFPREIEEKSAVDVDERKQKKLRLDPKSVFEKEGVPDFMAPSTSTAWDDKKQKQSRYKIDIKLSTASPEGQIPEERFGTDSASTSNLDEERKFPAAESSRNIAEEFKYDVDERTMRTKPEERHRGVQEDRRRRNEEWEGKRDWKYDRRHWDDTRRFSKGDYGRRHGGRHYGGPKFRKDRFEDKRDRYLEKEWEGSIKDFEERQRRRNQEIRREELRRLRKRSDSSSN